MLRTRRSPSRSLPFSAKKQSLWCKLRLVFSKFRELNWITAMALICFFQNIVLHHDSIVHINLLLLLLLLCYFSKRKLNFKFRLFFVNKKIKQNILFGIGPNTLSIICKCSLLSWTFSFPFEKRKNKFYLKLKTKYNKLETKRRQ